MNASLQAVLQSVQLADVIDVLLVAACFFLTISWLRHSSPAGGTYRVLVAALLFGAVYVLADLFDLFLMERLLEVLFIVFIVAAVVVFQSDLRRLLDRVAAWSFLRGRRTVLASSPVEILTEAAAHLAAERVGALIAIRGDQLWESHLQGGVPLDGLISRPLLYSVFSPESPGHDGAMLIEGNRITRFAVHLPLATHLPEASRFGGTRHAAAVGLAEECDALVIVVSEERGTISVAERGELTEMASASDLGKRLERFWDEHYTEAGALAPGLWSRSTVENALMAAGLAGLTWMLFSYSGDTLFRVFEVPIEFRNMPEEWVLDHDSVPTAMVTLAGSERAFDRMSAEELTISFDLAEPEPGVNELPITAGSLDLPSGVRLAGVSPREVRVVARRQQSVEVPVHVRTTRALADSLTLVATPRTVRLLVLPDEEGALPARVLTSAVDAAEVERRGSVRVPLSLPPHARLPAGEPAEVEVRLRRAAAPGPADPELLAR